MKKLTLLFLVCTFVCSFSKSQTTDINDFTVTLSTAPADSLADPSGSMIQLTCILDINLDINLTKITVKIGTSPSGTDVFYKDLTPKTLSTTDGLFYSVVDDKMHLDFGLHPSGMYYAAIKISDNSGNKSLLKTASN